MYLKLAGQGLDIKNKAHLTKTFMIMLFQRKHAFLFFLLFFIQFNVTAQNTNVFIQISNGCEDAEEEEGVMDATSDDLDMGKHTVGLIFNNANIPAGANILSVSIQFTSSKSRSGLATLAIRGEKAALGSCYTSNGTNLSSRVKTNAVVNASISQPWATGQVYEISGLEAIVQEIVSNPGYALNDPIALIIEKINGGRRDAFSLHPENNPADAPILFIEYTPQFIISGRVYTVCDGAEDQPVQGATVEIQGGPSFPGGDPTTTTDANGYYEFPFTPNTNYIISVCKVVADKYGLDQTDVDIIDAHILNPSMSELDSPYKRLAADVMPNAAIDSDDSDKLEKYINDDLSVPNFYSFGGQHWRFVDSDFIFVNNNPFGFTVPGFRAYNDLPAQNWENQDFIAIKVGDVDCSYSADYETTRPTCTEINASCEDAEQVGTTVQLVSNDLDMGYELVGLMFNGSNVPPGVTITDAFVTFTCEQETSRRSCMLNIKGQQGGKSNCFTAQSNDISNRMNTSATVVWDISDEWLVDEEYSTPNIKAIVQEIVDAPGYSISDPITLMLDIHPDNDGGKREAYTFDNDPSKSPILCIRFSKPNDCNSLTSLSGKKRNDFTQIIEGNRTSNDATITNVKNHPNPFNDYTSFDFDLSKDTEVNLKIFNTLGQVIYNQTQFLTAGKQQLKVENLPIQSSTLLHYTIETNDDRQSGKMLYLK